jgi:hypothetical protein
MRYLLNILFVLITITSYSQYDSLSYLFFDLPIAESRDSISTFCDSSDLFKKKKSSHVSTRNGETLKTYYGKLITLDKVFIDKNIDSAKIQISTGTTWDEENSTTQNIVPITSYYYFSRKESAEKYYKEMADKITLYTNKTIPLAMVYFEDELVGYAQYWYQLDNPISSLSITFEKDLDSKFYQVSVELIRHEKSR